MGKKKIFLGALDIGSQNITYLLGEVNQRQLNLMGHGQVPSKGVRKSQIVDQEALTQVLCEFFENLTKRYSILPEDICLSQSGNHLRSITYETTLNLQGFHHTIDAQDVANVNQMALKKALPETDVFLHHVRQYYTINNVCIDQPFGHTANHLTVGYNAIIGNAQAIKDQLYVVNQFGFHVKNLVFSGISSALAVTTSIERENGICVINLGAQITEFVVYKNQIPVLMGTVPVGGQNFTNDLGSGLRVHFEDAERLKIEQGIPTSEQEGNIADVWVVGNRTIGDKKIKIKNIRTILNARAQELFDYIAQLVKNYEAKNDDKEPLLLSGIVLTGGGALLKNIETVAAQSFKSDCCVRGALANVDGELKTPCYSNCFGLLYYALQQNEQQSSQENETLWKRFSSWLGYKK